jgi:hypothetical protein
MIAELREMMVSSGLNMAAYAVGEPLSAGSCGSCSAICASCWMQSVVY